MREALSPDEVENLSFSASLRGYDRDEVDAFLKSLAADLREIEQRSERLYETLGQEMGDLLQHARDSADQMVREAEIEAGMLREQAEKDAAKIRDEAAGLARSTKEESEATAARTVDAANKTAEETRSRAERDASDSIAKAEDRVRTLEARETDARERLHALRLQLLELSDQLKKLEHRAVDDEAIMPAEEEASGQTGETIELQPSVESTVL